MVNIPSTPEIITVNSEALETQIRDLLPSQNGFGSELQASNVITPIIDLTAAAEGTGLRSDIQTALAFGSQTSFLTENATTALAASPGFYKIVGTSTVTSGTGTVSNKLNIIGASTQLIWSHEAPGVSSNGGTTAVLLDLVVWLKAGETLSVTSSNASSRIAGSFRQIASSDGTLVNPNGFPL